MNFIIPLLVVAQSYGASAYNADKLPRRTLYVALNKTPESEALKRALLTPWHERVNYDLSSLTGDVDKSGLRNHPVLVTLKTLECRRLRILRRYNLVFINTGFAPAIRVNRGGKWHYFPQQTYEATTYYEFFEWLHRDIWWDVVYVPQWEKAHAVELAYHYKNENIRASEFCEALIEKEPEKWCCYYQDGQGRMTIHTNEWETFDLEELGFKYYEKPSPARIKCPIKITIQGSPKVNRHD